VTVESTDQVPEYRAAMQAGRVCREGKILLQDFPEFRLGVLLGRYS
jgi:hypothetical protein